MIHGAQERTNTALSSQNAAIGTPLGESADGRKADMVAAGDLRSLYRHVICAWAAGLFSIGLAWGQDQFGVLHPWSCTFFIALTVTFVAGLKPCFSRPSRWLRHSGSGNAIAWIILALMPAAIWAALGWYGARQWSRRNVPTGVPGALIRMAGASLMDFRARFLLGHRLEGDHVVMFFDDRVLDQRFLVQA